MPQIDTVDCFDVITLRHALFYEFIGHTPIAAAPAYFTFFDADATAFHFPPLRQRVSPPSIFVASRVDATPSAMLLRAFAGKSVGRRVGAADCR